jgi:hypothetical protein
VVVKIAGAALATMSMLAASCAADKVTESRDIPLSEGKVRMVRTSVGSAIDGEKIELIFDDGGKQQRFFTGWNFNEFQAGEREGKLAIQMCKGWIEHAEPIAVGAGDQLKLVRLDLNRNCVDKSHEA